MADDIVERLRDHRHTLVDRCECVRCEAAAAIERLQEDRYDWQTVYQQAFNELERVGDEVVRLRTAGDALVAAIRNHDLTEDHLRAWQEARR